MPEPIDSTVVALARWQGETDRGMQENNRRLEKVSNNVDTMRGEVSGVKEDMVSLKTHVKIWSTLGSIIGAGIITYLTNHVS